MSDAASELAGIVAPLLRNVDEKTKRRKIKTVDRDGKVVREVELADVQGSLLKAKALEIAVDEKVRPRERICEICGKPFLVPKKGRLGRICRKKRCRSKQKVNATRNLYHSLSLEQRKERNRRHGLQKKNRKLYQARSRAKWSEAQKEKQRACNREYMRRKRAAEKASQ